MKEGDSFGLAIPFLLSASYPVSAPPAAASQRLGDCGQPAGGLLASAEWLSRENQLEGQVRGQSVLLAFVCRNPIVGAFWSLVRHTWGLECISVWGEGQGAALRLSEWRLWTSWVRAHHLAAVSKRATGLELRFCLERRGVGSWFASRVHTKLGMTCTFLLGLWRAISCKPPVLVPLCSCHCVGYQGVARRRDEIR